MKTAINMLGLTWEEVKRLQLEFGKNQLSVEKKDGFINKVIHIIVEPMFLLLIVAAIIYFILGEPGDGAVMLVFIAGIISIDLIQEWKTDKTLKALKDLSAPKIKVIRNGNESIIESVELVPGDIMLIYEGVKIPADGTIIKANDLCIDESSLTGESVPVWKSSTVNVEDNTEYWKKDYCYAGTLVTQGSATVHVKKTGAQTEYGKIGTNIVKAKEEKTPLQKQTGSIVKICGVIAAVLFIMVGILTYLNIPEHALGERIIESVLSGITLSMAMIPEEFPVILTVFLSMGAWRLAKKNSLVRKLPSVETLGAVSVLCVDKTGTITMNQMRLQEEWILGEDNKKLVEILGLSCEMDAYDPMEKAMLKHCEEKGFASKDLFNGKLISEYPFNNKLKMMGHVWKRNGKLIIAAKGSPENIIKICNLSEHQKEEIIEKNRKMSMEGLRVIGVAYAEIETEKDIPSDILECNLTFSGLVGLADPPREGVKEDILQCNKAGIRVVMITGDNGITAASIASKIGMKNIEHIISGDMLDEMEDEELKQKIKEVSIFSRVIPEHKMRIVKAFKENGEIVAMTGDGVNDAPALKYADIGIAMGKRGSEVSREAADMILLDDNFTTIVETVKDGRRLYDNIRKAVGYVFTIHIPIAAASLMGPILGISPIALILLPVHVVLLELIIDPTCSIVLERQPAESDVMDRKPRKPGEKLLSGKVLIKSVIQGIVIFIASFGTYYYFLGNNEENAPLARAMGILVIMFANLFLVQVNSSEKDSFIKSVSRLIKDRVMWIANLISITYIIVIIYSPIHQFLKLGTLSLFNFFSAMGIGALSVLWYEVVKVIIRKNK